MPRVLINTSSRDFGVHFIGPDGKTRVGPWLLHDTPEEVHAILRWAGASAADLAEHDGDLRRWGTSTIAAVFTDRKYAALIERGRGWPWTAYALRAKKAAGKYPRRVTRRTTPAPRISNHATIRATLTAGNTSNGVMSETVHRRTRSRD